MLSLDYIRAALPAPPATVLEIGAGKGELARTLRNDGYDVTAIDPKAPDGDPDVTRGVLLDVQGDFEAAVAVLSLHHIEPLEASFEHLASVLRPGAPLVIDEFDMGQLDERAVDWWLERRRATGGHEGGTAQDVLTGIRSHLHRFVAISAALEPRFALGEPQRVPYLHRWKLPEGFLEDEERLIATGDLPVTGVRMVATRK